MELFHCIEGSLLAYMFPWRNFNIHATFQLHKHFYSETKKGSLDY